MASGDTFVAVLDDAVVGVVTLAEADATHGSPFYDRPDVASFGQFGVLPELQRQGIGSRLMDIVEARAREKGVVELALDTSEHADALIAMYTKRGYRFIELRPVGSGQLPERHSQQAAQVMKPSTLTIELVTPTEVALAEYGSIPISFEVREVMDVHAAEPSAGFHLAPHSVAKPYVKDYDSGTNEGPTGWPLRFDLSAWILVLARSDGQAIGGAAVARQTPALAMLEGRSDLVVLWDIRVRPEARRRGVGAALFTAAEAWALDRGCQQLKVETQNINVPACRFYARQGCVLRGVHRGAYAECPDEIQLLWYKDLSPPTLSR